MLKVLQKAGLAEEAYSAVNPVTLHGLLVSNWEIKFSFT